MGGGEGGGGGGGVGGGEGGRGRGGGGGGALLKRPAAAADRVGRVISRQIWPQVKAEKIFFPIAISKISFRGISPARGRGTRISALFPGILLCMNC